MMKYDPSLSYTRQFLASVGLIAALYGGSMLLSALIGACVALLSGYSVQYDWLFEEIGTMVATVLLVGFWWIVFTVFLRYCDRCDRKEKK